MTLDFTIESYDHIRYEFGQQVAGPFGNINRAIKIEPNISGGEGFTVTLFNLDGNHPLWQNNVQMAPKQMGIVFQSNEKIVLRGFGTDFNGFPFSGYGVTLNIENGKVKNFVMHMHDRNVDIHYLVKN